MFFVPRDSYQLLRLRAQLLAIPASVQLSQRTPPSFAPAIRGDSELYGYWHIDDDSWLHDLVSGRERWVVLRYELVDPGHVGRKQTTPDLRVTARFPHPTWTKSKPSIAQVRVLFKQNEESDASEPFADAELARAPVTKPNAQDKKQFPRCRKA